MTVGNPHNDRGEWVSLLHVGEELRIHRLVTVDGDRAAHRLSVLRIGQKEATRPP